MSPIIKEEYISALPHLIITLPLLRCFSIKNGLGQPPDDIGNI